MIGRNIYKFSEEQNNEEVVKCIECNNHLAPDQIGNPKYYDQNNNPHCIKHVADCESCWKRLPKVDMREGTFINMYYCKACYDELFTICPNPNCKRSTMYSTLISPTNRDRGGNMQHGGCVECAAKCKNCDKILQIDDETTHLGPEGRHHYCENCFYEKYAVCSDCSKTIKSDDATYIEGEGDFCYDCFDEKYYLCNHCNGEVEKPDAIEFDDEYYHSDCVPEDALKITRIEAEFNPEALTGFSYTKKDRLLMSLMKMLPISVKELKQSNPSLAAGLGDLINFAKGKDLTLELVEEFRASLQPEEFPVEYSTWLGSQRSVVKNTPQLVLKILASSEILSKLNESKILISLFNAINELSLQLGHPYSPSQIGWARIEISPDKEYMLVDEIQTDHMNSIFKMKKRDFKTEEARIKVRNDNNLTDEQLDTYLPKLQSILKDFPNIASNAVQKFAKANGIKKIFWHTYESGVNLKGNEPPPSFYTSVPKENLYLPSSERPFGLEGEFFEKEAKKAYLRYKLAKLWTKRFN